MNATKYIDKENLHIDVVIGPSFDNADQIVAEAEKSNLDISLNFNVKKMSKLMLKSDIGSVRIDDSVDMVNHRITNVADPSNNQDVATKAYVDAASASMKTCRFDGDVDGHTGPCAGYTWEDCVIAHCRGVAAPYGNYDTDYNYWFDSGISHAPGDYYDIQSRCSDGACDDRYSISSGNFLCTK